MGLQCPDQVVLIGDPALILPRKMTFHVPDRLCWLEGVGTLGFDEEFPACIIEEGRPQFLYLRDRVCIRPGEALGVIEAFTGRSPTLVGLDDR
jgi:hypothetical protein